MTIKIAHRLALAAALGVVVTAAGTAGRPAIATSAASLHALTFNDFRLVAAQGFGDNNNTFAWSMSWYKGNLYVGTNRAWHCFQTAMLNLVAPAANPYPYTDPDLDPPCNPDPQALPEAAEIWKMNPALGTPFSQTNWTRVYQSPYGGPYNGQPILVPITRTTVMTPAARDIGFRGMTTFDDGDANGPALYISGVSSRGLNGPSVPPPSLLRTTDGANFQAVPSAPGTVMGNINQLNGGCCIRGAVTYNGKFYAVIGDIQGAGAAFVASQPNLGNNAFQQLTPNGMAVYELAVFNGHLYLGVQSYLNGYSVVELNDAACPTLPCPSTAFTTVVPGGGGLGGGGSFSITSMHVFTPTTGPGAGVGHLYVGTDGLGLIHQPAEIVRVNPDNTWDLVVGKKRTVNGSTVSPLSGLGAGFGWLFNAHMWRMDDYNGVLYVGTYDSSANLKNTIIGPLLRPLMGFDIWATSDGVTFTPVTLDAFGYYLNVGARTMAATPYGLFVGSANLWKGLRVWLGSIPGQAMQLAPTSLQVATAPQQGNVALTWQAPQTASVFHVYRSTSTPHTLPPATTAATSNPDTAGTSATTSATDTGSGPVWLPGAYTEIGTTTTTYFVDHSAVTGGQYSYYVVAEDRAGNLSAPSSVATNLGLLPNPTFGSVRAVLRHVAANHGMTMIEAFGVGQSLWAAEARMRVGDVKDALALLDRAQRRVASQAHGLTAKLHVEALMRSLRGLEQRVYLVGSHVLPASTVE